MKPTILIVVCTIATGACAGSPMAPTIPKQTSDLTVYTAQLSPASLAPPASPMPSQPLPAFDPSTPSKTWQTGYIGSQYVGVEEAARQHAAKVEAQRQIVLAQTVPLTPEQLAAFWAPTPPSTVAQFLAAAGSVSVGGTPGAGPLLSNVYTP